MSHVKSLSGKITRSFATLTAKFMGVGIAVTIAAAIVMHYAVVEVEKRHLMEREEGLATMLANSLKLPFTQILLYDEIGLMSEGGLLDLYVSRMMADKEMGVVYAMVLDPEGSVLAHSDLTLFHSRPRDPLTKAALSSTDLTLSYVGDPIRGGTLDVSVPLSVSSKRFGTLRFGHSLGELARQYAALKRKTLVLTVVGSGFMILVLYLTAKVLARPIRRLSAALNSVHLGNLAAVSLPARQDEIGDLQESYRIMVDRLNAQERERERTREHMASTEKMAAVGMISAGIAHEINNPLTGAMHGVRALADGSLSPGKREQYVNVVAGSLDRIRRSVSQLLNYSTVHSLNFSECDISQVVERSIFLLSYQLEKSGIEVDNRVPPLTVSADAHQLEQVLVNMILNALAAMPRGGKLTFRHLTDDGFLTLVIEDTGDGIPSEILDRIFDPFFTTKGIGRGTGLGLAVCKKIVDQHGGRISVDSQGGEGTRFRISLPLSSLGRETA